MGEGPLWDWSREQLWWVDSLGPALYQYEFHTGQTHSWKLPGQTVGSLAVRESVGLILAMDTGFYHFDPDSGNTELIVEPLAGQSGIRFNDGKVDPFGNFIAGAMNIDHHGEVNCAMYRLSADLEVTKLLDGFTCFNGPCFSPDGEKIYLTGRNDGEIEVFDYDLQKGITNSNSVMTNCNPDGATVDQQGYIWSAQWTDECILRLSPEGKGDTKISIPGQIVSSVMFGGPELDLIYVTTVGGKVGDDSPTNERSGQTLVIENSGYKGRPENLFKG